MHLRRPGRAGCRPARHRSTPRGAAAVLLSGFLVACAGSPPPSVAPATTVPVVTAVTPTPAPTTRATATTAEPTTSGPPTTSVPGTTAVAPPAETPPPPDTAAGQPAAPVPTVWPPYQPLPGVTGLAALTGLLGDEATTARPALAAKIDNHPRARPQWGLEAADVVFEENVEGITRFIAVFHSRRPEEIGPIRSSRSSDLAILAALNRPVLAWSGGNPGVTAAVRAAADAGVLVDLSALRQGGCYRRSGERRAPHNLVLDPACAEARAADAGPARPPWQLSGGWQAAAPYGPDSTFGVAMDGVRVEWTWDPAAQIYLRSQDGEPHTTKSGVRVAASNVLVLEVAHQPSAVDRRSPEAITVGEGHGFLHRDGVAVEIRWSRPTAQDPFTFTTNEGAPAFLDLGNAFVELTRA